MKVLKFRVWNPKHKEMRFWGFDGNHCFIGPPTGAGVDLMTCSMSMQFTGLKVKNGKEIYDGDILTCHSGYKWIVSWNEDLHDHDAEAKKNGYSLSRLAKDEPTV